MIDITSTSQTFEQYAADIRKVESLSHLRSITKDYGHLARDAHKIATDMNQSHFIEFMIGIELEKKRQFPGKRWANRYSVVALPLQMVIVQKMAVKYNAPFGTVYLRMKKDGFFDK